MADNDKKAGEVATRGGEMMELLCELIQQHQFSNADIGFACSRVAGHAMALEAKDDPQAFAHNVSLARKHLSEQAQESFSEAGQGL